MHELSCCVITSFEGAQKVKWVGCRKGAGEQYKMLWIINHCSVLVWVSFVKCFQAGMFVSCWGVQTRVTIPWQKETTLPSIMHMFIPLCICIYIYIQYIYGYYTAARCRVDVLFWVGFWIPRLQLIRQAHLAKTGTPTDPSPTDPLPHLEVGLFDLVASETHVSKQVVLAEH